MNDAEVRLQVIIDSSTAEKSVSNISKKTQELSNNISKKTQELSNNILKKTQELSSKFTQVGKTMTVGITVPLTAIATAGVKYNSEIETYSTNLTTLLSGNKKQADDLLKSLKQMASTTPFETKDLIKSTQTMLGFGIEVNKSQKYLKQLGDISMGDSQKLESLTLAFSQVSSAGKLSGQDLLQMINAGFNPLNIISQKTGESMASLKKRMGEGSLSADEVAQSLQWATEEGGLFYKAMDKASQTTAGKISTLKDDFNSAIGSMTESLLPFVTTLVTKLSQIFQWLNSLDQSQKTIILTIAGVLAVAGPLLMILGKIMPMLSALPAVISFITSPIGLIVVAIGALIGVFVYLMATSEQFRNAMQSIFSFVWGFISPIITNIMNLFTGLIQIIKGAVMIIGGLLTGDFKLIADGFASIFRGIGNVAISVLNGIINTINRFLKAFSTGINLAIGLANKVPGVNIPKVNLQIPNIPKLNVGTNNVQHEGLAYLHEGEAVVPKKYNPALGGNIGSTYVTVIADMDVNKFGKAFVNNIKTFSGGAKNSYNYGGAR